MQCVLHGWYPLMCSRCLFPRVIIRRSLASTQKHSHPLNLINLITYQCCSNVSINFFQVEMAGFEALNQVLLACQSPYYQELIVVLFIWVLVCSSELWLALVRDMAAQSIITTDRHCETDGRKDDVYSQNSDRGIRCLQQLYCRCTAYYLRLARQVPAQIGRGRIFHHLELWVLYIGAAQNGKMLKISCSATY